MKAKLLKKIRKIYKYRFDENGRVIITNNKSQYVESFKNIETFLISYVYEKIGIMTGVDYEKHILLRRNKQAYLKELSNHKYRYENTTT